MLCIAVCEDEALQREIIFELLNKYKSERPGIDLQPYFFYSADNLLQSINSGQKFSMFILDILMPVMNGIELAQILRKNDADATLIFLTSSAEYALDAFKVSAAQYILKPVQKATLFPVLDMVIAAMKQKKERFFMLTVQNHTLKIYFNLIVCVELAGRMLRFYLENGDILLSSTIRVSFASALSPLLMDSRFLHEHKSFVLNMEHVQEIGNASFRMKGGIEVPIPKYNFAKAKAKYFAWLEQNNV